jgi:hypothetical protein
MKKPVSLQDSLTQKPTAAPEPAMPPPTPEAPVKLRLTDTRVPTSLRIEPEKLERLKIIAVRRRVRVNELLLQAIDAWLAVHGREAA